MISTIPDQMLALKAIDNASPEIASWPFRSPSRSDSSASQEGGSPISRELVTDAFHESGIAVLDFITSVLAWGDSCKTL